MSEGIERADDAHASVFSFRNFRLAMGARFALTIGIQMQSVAIGWQVYALTGHARDLGFVGLAQFVPVASLSLVAGHVADRFDRRRVVLACELGMAVCAAALDLLTRAGLASRLSIYGVVAAFGVLRAFSGPASSALLPNLVPKSHYQQAVAWGSSIWQIATIVGPAAGGAAFFIGTKALVGGANLDGTARGCALVYEVAGALTVAAAAMIFQMQVRSARAERQPPSLHTLFEGVRYVFAKKILLGSISLDLFAVLLGGATALLPIFARDILSAGPIGLGILRSAPGVGAAATAILLARSPLRRHAGPLMFFCVFVFGVATCVFAVSRNIVVSAIALVILGASDMVSVVIRSTLVQLTTPDEKRGRVSAVNMIFVGASNELGEFESGVTAEWLGATRAALVGGIATCVVVASWIGLFPQLFKVDRLEDEKAG